MCIGTLEQVVYWNIGTCLLEHWNMCIGTCCVLLCVGTLEHVRRAGGGGVTALVSAASHT